MGVDLFFVLSGFLITGILVNEREKKTFAPYIGNFYLRRVKRILPAYVVVLAVTGVVFGFEFLRFWYWYIGGMNFMMPLGIPSPETLPLWSLAVEEQFYLFWPIAVYFLGRRQLIGLSAGMMVTAPLLRYVCTPLFSSHWAIYMLMPFRMDTLAAGALIALIWPELQTRLESGTRRRHLQRQVLVAGICVIGLAMAGLVWMSSHGISTAANSRAGNVGVFELVLAIVTSLFLITLMGWGKTLLSTWPFMWVGRVSYSIYLFHLTALYLVGNHGWYATAGLTMAYSLGMWFLVENPINRVGHKKATVLISA
jgi:peptidoglycan/LPS O-acetylase OafA/YrhL